MDGASSVELWWIPVGADTHVQAASLACYEWLAAFTGGRPRQTLVHAGLTGALDGRPFALEVAPAFQFPASNDELSGPVGASWAGRWRLFRYRVHTGWDTEAHLPDEARAVAPPVRLDGRGATVGRVLALSQQSPCYVWGRRRPGHPEMWTSNSTVAWTLTKAGIDTATLAVPDGCRAPGWASGLAEAGDWPVGGSGPRRGPGAP